MVIAPGWTFSTDPQLEPKIRDIVGLCLAPRPGLPERQTHDCQRNGTTSLFAASEAATVKINADACYERHTNKELVEIYFGIITRPAARRGTFESVPDLKTAIRALTDAYNTRCQPFTWTKNADQILDKTKRRTPRARDTSLCVSVGAVG
ncbi:hypothetical protein [Streptomyces sp. NPDC048527]|uniref:hypothetical protein n=1 Tax=Streptomyces sp. NPDC048527 TaxID=3365568 RepID=UPI0037229881